MVPFILSGQVRTSGLARALVSLLLISCISVPFVGSGAVWELETDAHFGVAGHLKEGIDITGNRLVLAQEPQTNLQKDWTGDPGQSEWVDATGYLSKKDLDGSDPERLTLAKETWVEFNNAPTARVEHVAVWDTSRNKMVVFGGQRGPENLDDVWDFTPSDDTWMARGNATDARYWHSGSWDIQNRQLLVHGGMVDTGSSTKHDNDTWAFDPGSGSWALKAPAAKKRYGHASAWDPVHQRLFVMGGYADGAISRELWAYEPIGETWAKKANMQVALYEHTAVWADDLGLVLVYGGLKSGGIPSKDLWTYDPDTDQWSQFSNGGTPRSGHGSVWDPENGEMIMFGGHSGSTEFNDTWIYRPDTDTWRRGKDLPAQPRTGLTVVWDTDREQALVYGGKGDQGTLSEVWGYSPFFIKSGEMVSSAFNIGSIADLANVSWVAEEEPEGCTGASVKVQLAASDSLTPSGFRFAGPYGSDSYYDNGESIDRSLKGKKFIRYKAILSTTSGTCTPVLKELRINYMTYVGSGNYTTAPFDTGSSHLDLISVDYLYDNPARTDILVFLRSGHQVDMSGGASPWEEVRPRDTALTTPQGRYLQFRVHMTTTDPGRTPLLEELELTYNSVPQLIPSPVVPLEGGSGTEFVYRVIYTDGDGETPVVRRVHIDGKAHDMEPEEYDYRIGANFTFKTKLSSGAHRFSFEFSDGMNITKVPVEGEFEGPLVNDVPTASLKVTKAAAVGDKVKFDASASSDTDGEIVQYKFDFGDGTDSDWQDASTVKHVYKKKGTYNVKVHVRDDLGTEVVSLGTDIKVGEKGSGFVPAPGPILTLLAMVAACPMSIIRKRIYGKI